MQSFLVMEDISREVSITFRNETKTFTICEDHVKTEEGMYCLNVELPNSRYQVDTNQYQIMGFATKKLTRHGIGIDVVLGGRIPLNRTNTQPFRWVTVNVMRGNMMMTKNTFEYLFNVTPLRVRLKDLFSSRNQAMSHETNYGTSSYRETVQDSTVQDSTDVPDMIVDQSKSPVMSRISRSQGLLQDIGYPISLKTYSQRDDSLNHLLQDLNVHDPNRDRSFITPFLFPVDSGMSFPSFSGVSDIRTSDLENLEF